jgi:hypothetical protein
MVDAQITDHKAKSISMKEHAANQARSGVRILQGSQGTIWAKYESWAFMRIPTFHQMSPDPHEVHQVLWHGRTAIATYLLEPDDYHPANAWLYVCTDRSYTLENLPPPMRRNVRRGLKELVIAPLTSEQLLTHGVQAFCDTRRRSGLSDGTPEGFRERFTARIRSPEHVFLGAWKENLLAAFLSLTEVEDWVEIEGSFSTDDLLQYRPNDTLMYYALSHYLVEGSCRVVSYGLSSLQTESNATGLHTFKTKVGFEARPVHRAFELHPFLRPFANRVMLRSINAVRHFRPQDRRLKKAGGVLACLLGNTNMMEVTESITNNKY